MFQLMAKNIRENLDPIESCLIFGECANPKEFCFALFYLGGILFF